MPLVSWPAAGVANKEARRAPAQYVQIRVRGYSLNLETFQRDVKVRTSDTATLFAGVYLTVGSLRDLFRKSISTRSSTTELLNHFHHPMTVDAAGTFAPRGGLEEWLEVNSGLCGNTGSTSL